MFREDELWVYRKGDRAEPPRPGISLDALGDDDVLVRVPIVTTRLGQERLFGEEVLLWLRRDGSTYKIARTMEDFQLP
jgi:hypothetical protein